MREIKEAIGYRPAFVANVSPTKSDRDKSAELRHLYETVSETSLSIPSGVITLYLHNHVQRTFTPNRSILPKDYLQCKAQGK